MPRQARIVAVGYPHHITQRGNYRQNIFVDDTDRKKYLQIVKEQSQAYHLTILAYCLMDNHVHFIAIPENGHALGTVFKHVNMKYSQYFNKKMGAGGHLWQGRFYSCIMDEEHMLVCARYIERNPVRALLVRKPWDWQWSSAQVHCGFGGKDILGVEQIFKYLGYTHDEWQCYLEEEDEAEQQKKIQRHTMRGHVLGSDSFIKKLELIVNQVLTVRGRGRPKKYEK